MREFPDLRIILPTEEIVDEFRQVNNLLGLVRTNVKEVVEYCVAYWLDHPEPWGNEPISAIDQLYAFLDTDFLRDLRPIQETERDLQDTRTCLKAIGISVYLTIMPVIDHLRLPDFVRQALRVDGWLGDALIVSTVRRVHHTQVQVYIPNVTAGRYHSTHHRPDPAFSGNAGFAEQPTR